MGAARIAPAIARPAPFWPCTSKKLNVFGGFRHIDKSSNNHVAVKNGDEIA